MKSIYLCIALMLPTLLAAQLRVNAGRDTTFCESCVSNGTLKLGTAMKIENGTPPYTYKWTTKLNLFSNSYFYAKTFLNDTTLANPVIKSPFGGMRWYPFILEVRDAKQQVAVDTILVRFSEFYLSLTVIYYFQNVGDEITLGQNNIGGGIKPYKSYKWSPATGLSNPDSLNTKCKVTKSMSYTLTVTDSIGCTSSDQIYIQVPKPANIFAPKGTEWHYGFQRHKVGSIVENNYFHYISTGDTAINNRLCNKIYRDNAYSACRISPAYTYLTQSNDTVFIYGQVSKKFYPLYIWNAKAGSSWITEGNVTTLVKSVKDTLLANNTIRKYEVEYSTDSLNRCSSTILEGIGDTNYLNYYAIEGITACDEPIRYSGLRCYYRGGIGLQKWASIACNAIFNSDLTPKTYLGTTDSWNELAGGWTFYQHTYFLNGDTTITGLKYHRIFHTTDSVMSLKQSNYIGAIREDNGKWLFCENNQTKESLLYDFNLNVGSTILVHSPDIADTVKVKAIETTLINGEMRKIFSMQMFDKYLNKYIDINPWIEGIGSMDGLFMNNPFLADSGDNLICYHHNNDWFYINPSYKTCRLPTAIETPIADRQCMISNLRNSRFSVKCSEDIEQISVRDLRGRLLKASFPMQSEASIVLSNLPNGVYIVSIKTAKQVINKKIVVNR